MGWGVAQSNMTPLHIAYNVFFRAVYTFISSSFFCHMPTFNTHLVLFFFLSFSLRVEGFVQESSQLWFTQNMAVWSGDG